MNFLVFLSTYILPFFIFYVVAYGLWKGQNVYESFAEGAKGGFQTAFGILPTLVGLLVAVGVLRASGFLDLLAGIFKLFLKNSGFPSELLPLVLVRLFSNSAATGLALDLFKSWGPDSEQGLLASLFLSSTETVFYTMSIYFMSVKIKKTRYTLQGALLATLAGIVASVFSGERDEIGSGKKYFHLLSTEGKLTLVYNDKKKAIVFFSFVLSFASRNPVCRIFSRSHMLVVAEDFDEIAGIGKTAAVSDLCDGFIRVGKLFTGYFDPVIVQVIHGSAVGKFFKIAAEIAGIQIRAPCKGSKLQIFAIVIFNHGKDRFQAGKNAGIPGKGHFPDNRAGRKEFRIADRYSHKG